MTPPLELFTRPEQLAQIRHFNEQFWEGRFTEEQLVCVDTSSSHEQSIDDLEVLHVEFGSPELNFEMWWRIIEAGWPERIWRSWNHIQTDPEGLRALGHNVHHYEPGIHPVRLNLLAHWEPKHGRTIEWVRQQVRSSGEILAHAEILSTYGLNPSLLRHQDGHSMPYIDLAGFEAFATGWGEWLRCPYILWRRDDQRNELSTSWTDQRFHDWSCPIVLSRS